MNGSLLDLVVPLICLAQLSSPCLRELLSAGFLSPYFFFSELFSFSPCFYFTSWSDWPCIKLYFVLLECITRLSPIKIILREALVIFGHSTYSLTSTSSLIPCLHVHIWHCQAKRMMEYNWVWKAFTWIGMVIQYLDADLPRHSSSQWRLGALEERHVKLCWQSVCRSRPGYTCCSLLLFLAAPVAQPAALLKWSSAFSPSGCVGFRLLFSLFFLHYKP